MVGRGGGRGPDACVRLSVLSPFRVHHRLYDSLPGGGRGGEGFEQKGEFEGEFEQKSIHEQFDPNFFPQSQRFSAIEFLNCSRHRFRWLFSLGLVNTCIFGLHQRRNLVITEEWKGAKPRGGQWGNGRCLILYIRMGGQLGSNFRSLSYYYFII